MAERTTGGGRVWQALDVLFLLMFAFGAIVQFNDPDPLRWALLYTLAATSCALALARRLVWWLPAGIAAVCVVWAAALAPRVIGRVRFMDMFGAFEMKSAGIEQAREMYGLLLIAAYMLVLLVRALRARRVQLPSLPGG